MKKPESGMKIYVPTSLHVYRGEDDFQGGIAKINKIEYKDYLPEDHCNYIFVGIEENPGVMYNYGSLMKQQNELRERYGEQVAHPDPDNRPEFNQPDADWQ